MQPGTTMVPPSMAPPQYQQQPPQQTRMPPAVAGDNNQQAQAAALPTSHAHTKLEGGGRVLCIGELKDWMNEPYLFECFDTDGELDIIKVVRNPGPPFNSKGHGFIMFTSHAAAQRNLQTKNGSPMPKSKQPFKLSWAPRELEDALEYTIFVGDLAADVTDSMLLDTFRASYPSIKSAKVVKDRVTGHTKGYGFVSFGLKIEQIDAQIDMNGKICSTRPMRIGPANGSTKASYQQTSQGAPSQDDPSNSTIFVGNLDANVTNDLLRQVFGKYGQLVHVKIPIGKRCGFVQFAHRSCAEEAIQTLNGTQLAGHNIRLSWGRSPSNKQVDPNKWSGSSGHYGYTPTGYETYGNAPAVAAAAAAQDPNLYYAGYPGYGSFRHHSQQQQVDPNKWSGSSGHYGYTPTGYETYGNAPAVAAAQDPNLYYAGYPGYGSFRHHSQQQQ